VEVIPAAFCRHCRRRKLALRKRGLCARCHADLGVLMLYPAGRQQVGRARNYGLGLAAFASAVPATPTAAPPGSLAKMRVMRRRLLAGESLFHPLDATDQVRHLAFVFADAAPWSGGPTGLEDTAESIEVAG
jgi:hypothetical protein